MSSSPDLTSSIWWEKYSSLSRVIGAEPPIGHAHILVSNFLVIPKLLQLHDHNYGSLNLWSSEKQELCWADSPKDEHILGVLGISIYIYMYIRRIALDTPIHFFLSDSELSSPSLLWSWSSGHPTQTKVEGKEASPISCPSEVWGGLWALGSIWFKGVGV